MSDTTRRHPRTLAEAFGPYTSTHIEEPPAPRTWRHRIAEACYFIAALAIFALMLTAPAWWPDDLHPVTTEAHR